MPKPPKGKSGTSRSKPKTRTKKSQTKASKSKTRSKAKSSSGAKASTAKKKRRSTPRKKTSAGSRFKSSFVLIGSGFLIGAAAAILILHLFGVFEHLTSSQTEVKPSPQAKSAPVKQAAKKVKPVYTSAFEEKNRLDQQIKQLDQALFRILGDLSIPEDDIDYTELTHKKSQAREWHLATIDVRLQPQMSAEQFTKKLTPALARLSIQPAPRVTRSTKGEITTVTLSVNGLSTHVLRLLAPETASLPPVSPIPTEDVRKPKVALVIDDLGQDMSLARCFLKIRAPLAFAILPFQPHSEQLAREVHRAGKVVMLHLPMEPENYPNVNPGPGALFRTMDRDQIEQAVYEAIADVPYISGVNNHMGSSFTEDPERMLWVLEALQEQDLFFLDSRTSARTKTNLLARNMRIKIAERSVFLDNVQEEEAIRVQLRRLVTLARQKGQAIAIGHPYYVTCQVLTDEFNYLTSKVELVPVTSLVH